MRDYREWFHLSKCLPDGSTTDREKKSYSQNIELVSPHHSNCPQHIYRFMCIYAHLYTYLCVLLYYYTYFLWTLKNCCQKIMLNNENFSEMFNFIGKCMKSVDRQRFKIEEFWFSYKCFSFIWWQIFPHSSKICSFGHILLKGHLSLWENQKRYSISYLRERVRK